MLSGSRRRKVYHITEAGRAECEGIVAPSQKVGELFGNPPNQTFLRGRDLLIQELKDKKKLILTDYQELARLHCCEASQMNC